MPTLPISDLQPFPGNPRRGNLDVLVESLERLGQYRPIVVNEGTKTGRRLEVLAGNHTLAAAKRLGWSEIEVHLVDVDDDTARRIVVVDNRSNDLASYDDAELAAILDALPSLEATGWTDDELAKFRAALEGTPADSGTEDVYSERFEIVVECDSEEQQERVYQRLSEEGLRCRLLTL